MHARDVALTAALLVAMTAIHGCHDDIAETSPQVEDRQFGSVLDEQEFTSAAQALPVAALRDPPEALPSPSSLPRRVTLQNLPPIAMQGTWPKPLGSPGTCEAQSFGYGLGSYTAARAPDGSVKWSPQSTENQVSAAFEFALAESNGFATCPKGGLATPHLSRLASLGSASAADVPYEPSCTYFTSIDLNKSYADAARLRIGSFATMRLKDIANPLNRIREYLANEQAVAFSGLVYAGYGSTSGPPLIDGYFYDQGGAWSGGHGQLLVGYDNDLGAAAPRLPGMLLVQNSFSAQWPTPESASKAPPGMLYWSYATFLENQNFAAVAYPYDSSPPSGTILTASSADAPIHAIKRSYQWGPVAGGDVWLILMHHISEPIRITAVSLQEPAPGTGVATGNYGQYISNGYTYLRRTDGKAFLPGTYYVSVEAQTLAGESISYSGTLTVGSALPTTPAAASLVAATNKLTGSTGAPATVTNQ